MAGDDNLDPGIQQLVRFLQAEDFQTTDSGDGVSKVGTMPCAVPYPHVFISSAPDRMVTDALRLSQVLAGAGVLLSPIGGAVTIQATFDPADWSAIIHLAGLDDAGFAVAQAKSFLPGGTK